MIVSRSDTMHPQSPPLTIIGTVRKEYDDQLLYWEWHLIPKWPSISILARFPEQLLKDLVSRGSPGECYMIYSFLGDDFGVLSCPFGALFCSVVFGWRYTSYSKLCSVHNWWCVAHRRSVAVLCMLYKIRCNTMHRLAAEPRRTAGLLFPSQCPTGTILLSPYSLVWYWPVSRAGLLFYWHKMLYLYYSLLLFSPVTSFCL